MGICAVTASVIQKYMPCNVLTLGSQDNISIVDSKGGSITSVDIKAHKGGEVVGDLNYPIDIGQYDLVVDCGTTEHCSNIFQAIKNAAGAVKVGGRILHHSPVSMINHGYYNICPVFFRDYYEVNGWSLERFDMMNINDNIITVGNPFERIKCDQEFLVLIVSRRLETSTVDKLPLQLEYR